MKILLIHGPNLNMLGQRNTALYGSKTLTQINRLLSKRAAELGVEIATFQSNSEGALIDFIQAQFSKAAGIIINPGALTHYGLSLRVGLVGICRCAGISDSRDEGEVMSERLLRLRQKLAEKELDGILISQPENRHYLGGFDGSAGFLLVTATESILA